ncbi:MAG: hypothetical protein HW397_82 [Dehalococcoidia bacterium]|nr:hypothetical protein [Dehalococcoidia bacterium]
MGWAMSDFSRVVEKPLACECKFMSVLRNVRGAQKRDD